MVGMLLWYIIKVCCFFLLLPQDRHTLVWGMVLVFGSHLRYWCLWHTGMEDAGTSPPSATVADIPRRVVSNTLLVRSCRGYRSVLQFLGKQACMATLKASMKAWQYHLSSTFVWHCRSSTISLWACWRAQAVVVWWTSACLMTSVAYFMASKAWASFVWAASSMFKSRALWQRFPMALFPSNCSRAVFILSCRGRSLSDSTSGTTLGGKAHAHHLWCLWHGRLEQWVSNMSEAGDVTWDGHPWRHLYEGCHWGRDGWVCPLWPKAQGAELQGLSMVVLLSMPCWGAGAEAVREACCSHAKAPWSSRLVAMAMALGGSTVLTREGGSTRVVVGVWGTVVVLTGCRLLRSMSISCGLWAGSLGVPASKRGSSSKVNCKASSSPFKPSRHTTLSLCCNSLWICSWWSYP